MTAIALLCALATAHGSTPGRNTKMVTGLALLQLVERGVVHLADPAEKYIPEMRQMQNPYPWAPPVTLIQLATMTAGIQRGIAVSADKQAKTWEEAIAIAIPSFKYQYEPGTASRYSNAGYSMLGLALSRAAKRPFTDVSDLAKLMRFQMLGGNERVLSDKALQASYQLLVPTTANLQYGDGVGFTVVRDPDAKLTAVGHGGAGPEYFVSSYEFDGTSKTGVILLANTIHGQANYKPLVRRILALLNPTSSGGSGQSELEQH